MKSTYIRLIEREQSLLGDVQIIADVAYWPIRIVEVSQTELDSASQRIIRYVGAGYSNIDSLRSRLGNPSDLDYRLGSLAESNWITVEQRDDATLLSINEKSAECGNKVIAQVSDAVSYTPIQLSFVANALQLEELDPDIPVLADPNAIAFPSETRFLECLLMVILSGKNKARAVRAFVGTQDVVSMQEILFDLVLDASPRLARTKLAPTKQSATVDREIDAADVFVSGKEAALADKGGKQNVRLNMEAQSHRVHHRLEQSASVELLSGRNAHELALEAALRDAVHRVLIVTPFIRRRLTDINFRRSLSSALERGVTVLIIHGMPTHGDQFDDTLHEDQRIEELLEQLGSNGSRLTFVRVTDGTRRANGEHSKILVCDDKWAVVTSFNWLSYQETNETGIRFDHAESIVKLVDDITKHASSKALPASRRIDVASPWPYSDREMSEFIYGEYNSQ